MGLGVILAMSLIGAIVGIWASGMITADVPNTHLRKFSRDIEQGEILLMVMCPRTTSRKSAACSASSTRMPTRAGAIRPSRHSLKETNPVS
jgi:hypothetical protein